MAIQEQLYMNRDTGELLTYEEMLKQWREEYDGDDDTNCCPISEQYEKHTLRKTQIGIGIGHLIRAMRLYGFGYEEVEAMKNALLTNDFSDIEFCEDCYTEDWKNNN